MWETYSTTFPLKLEHVYQSRPTLYNVLIFCQQFSEDIGDKVVVVTIVTTVLVVLVGNIQNGSAL